MKKEIFDSLAILSSDSSASSTTPKRSPSVNISDELALCLDALMNTVGKQMNLSPQSVFERILDAGIESWVEQLSDKTKKSVGMIKTAAVEKTAHTDEVYEDNDPDPAHAQQAAYAQMTESYGYTPLTAHSVGKSGNGGGRKDQRGGGANGRKGSKQKNVHNAGKKHPPKRGGSRRRKYSTSKSYTSAQ